jgi:hypothetical protein
MISDFAFATKRLNWSCPLKTVVKGNPDSDAIAIEQSRFIATKAFQLRIMWTTQR